MLLDSHTLQVFSSTACWLLSKEARQTAAVGHARPSSELLDMLHRLPAVTWNPQGHVNKLYRSHNNFRCKIKLLYKFLIYSEWWWVDNFKSWIKKKKKRSFWTHIKKRKKKTRTMTAIASTTWHSHHDVQNTDNSYTLCLAYLKYSRINSDFMYSN